MRRMKNRISVATNAARAGSEEGVVRYVMAISLALAIIGLSYTWISAV